MINHSTRRIDLFKKLPIFERILKSRLFQPVLMLITLAFFTLAILTGLVGTAAGNRNFGIVFVWIVWWGLLIILLVPFMGRAWCTMCPIPAPGEWLQRRGIINRSKGRLSSMHWRWPRHLKNMWLQNFGFLSVAVFSTIILTRPAISAMVLLGFILTGIILSVLYENRVFCRYVCPVGGFIGLYSMVAPTELRVRDPQICASHTTKDCMVGNEHGYGCPWMVYPGKLERNAYCGMCMECIKTCPHNNIVINLRAPGGDLLIAGARRLDEAYKAFIMLACALLYSAVLLGPWGWIKNWANMESLPHWAAYASGFIVINLVGLPGLFWLTTALSKKISGQEKPTKRLFIDNAYILIPLGLAAWIAFSFGFVLINGSYALAVASDPFGWGWNLFGTTDSPWQPIGSGIIPFLQTGILTIGLLFSTNIGYRITRQNSRSHQQAMRALLPLATFMVVIILVFLRLYLG